MVSAPDAARLGGGEAFAGHPPDVGEALLDAYARDYVGAWSRLLDAIVLVPIQDLQGAEKMVAAAGQDDSPILKVLHEVATQTEIPADPRLGARQDRRRVRRSLTISSRLPAARATPPKSDRSSPNGCSVCAGSRPTCSTPTDRRAATISIWCAPQTGRWPRPRSPAHRPRYPAPHQLRHRHHEPGEGPARVGGRPRAELPRLGRAPFGGAAAQAADRGVQGGGK